MTQRERLTPDNGAQATSRPVVDRSSAGGSVGCWDDMFSALPADRRRELLALADRQGLLYAQQLEPVPPPRRPVLAGLLNGHPPELDSFQLADDTLDPQLDDGQREAVLRALNTPDICLVQGRPGTGKSRVVAEIIVRAAARGERVLFLAPSAAALDCVLERIAGREMLFPVRCLAQDERPESMPTCIRRLTFGERLRYFEDQTLGAARHGCVAAAQQVENRRRDQAVWPRLEAALEWLSRLNAETQALTARRDGIGAAVSAEAERGAEPNPSAFQAELAQTGARTAQVLAGLESRRAELQRQMEQVRAHGRRIDAELGPLLPLANAKRAGAWWTVAWWRASFCGDVAGRVEQLQRQLQEARESESTQIVAADALVAERVTIEEAARKDRAERIDAEIARRLAELDAGVSALVIEREQALSTWQAACRDVADPALVPETAEVEALRIRRADWERLLHQEEEQLGRAEKLAAELEQALPTLPDRLAGCVNLLAATPRALALDSRFGDAAVPPVLFDLLIFEDADQVTEADFQQAAVRARRWVLVGEPRPDAEPVAAPRRTGHTSAATARAIRPNALRTGFFQRLWRNLRWNPRRLPYVWEQSDSRLHCRLRPVAPEEECWIQRERLADRPDVELHILSRPRHLTVSPSGAVSRTRGEPELVEVVFPATTSVPEAKEYLYRELGEVTLQSAGVDWHWAELPERVVLRLTPAADPNAVLVPLCAGVRELVAPTAGDENDEAAEWRTCAVEFDRAAGWDRERAKAWAADQLGLRDSGRATTLSVDHRARPALAAWLTHLLGDEPAPPIPVCGTSFEFVAVPNLGANSEPRRRGESDARWRAGGGAAVATRTRTVKGGAGLETDLADSRRIDQMPAELRAVLPPRGLINYLEAVALVRRLESLLADSTFRAEAETWQQRHVCQTGEGCTQRPCAGRGVHCPPVAVIALYPAQAELIARLIQRVPALVASPVAFEIGPPSAFCHRECLAALVSLTRSHTHRAVPFGDGPQSLMLALTRAAGRLILFGDAGTLARRSQWQGALDHLDETAAERERAMAERIVRTVQHLDSILPTAPRDDSRLREGNPE